PRRPRRVFPGRMRTVPVRLSLAAPLAGRAAELLSTHLSAIPAGAARRGIAIPSLRAADRSSEPLPGCPQVSRARQPPGGGLGYGRLPRRHALGLPVERVRPRATPAGGLPGEGQI